MAVKKKPGKITTTVGPRGVAVEHEGGMRDFLRADSVPAARKALREGEPHPWVAVALDAWDRYVTEAGGEPW